MRRTRECASLKTLNCTSTTSHQQSATPTECEPCLPQAHKQRLTARVPLPTDSPNMTRYAWTVAFILRHLEKGHVLFPYDQIIRPLTERTPVPTPNFWITGGDRRSCHHVKLVPPAILHTRTQRDKPQNTPNENTNTEKWQSQTCVVSLVQRLASFFETLFHQRQHSKSLACCRHQISQWLPMTNLTRFLLGSAWRRCHHHVHSRERNVARAPYAKLLCWNLSNTTQPVSFAKLIATIDLDNWSLNWTVQCTGGNGLRANLNFNWEFLILARLNIFHTCPFLLSLKNLLMQHAIVRVARNFKLHWRLFQQCPIGNLSLHFLVPDRTSLWVLTFSNAKWWWTLLASISGTSSDWSCGSRQIHRTLDKIPPTVLLLHLRRSHITSTHHLHDKVPWTVGSIIIFFPILKHVGTV